MRNRRGERGNQILEFTLIGLPLIFILFSVANMSFAMLTLHTMQEAVEQGARYVVTHGGTCSTGGNTCGVTVGNVASVIANSSPGISSSNLSVTLTVCTAGVSTCPASGAVNVVTCNPLNSCLSNSTSWPSSSNNTPGGYDVIVSANATTNSPIFMYWPSGGTSVKIKSEKFSANSRQMLMF